MLLTMTDSQVSRPLLSDLSWRMFRSVALVTLFAFSTVGCGDQKSQIDRKPVYGNIVGAEGRSGMLTFTPIDTSIGPAASVDFKDGAYRFTAKVGPVPGEYNVSIEFEASASSAAARPNNRGGRMDRNAVDVGGVTYDEAKMTTASVSADGPFETDLDVTK
jgi:hypothetical protein